MAFSAADITSLIQQGLPAASDSGFCVEHVEGARVRCRMPFNERQLRPGGTLSGPTMMDLADAAMYASVLAQHGALEMAVTQNLNINFLRRPAQRDLIAIAEPLKVGRRSMVLDVRIYSDGDDKPVAHATGTYALPQQP
jgi:uncharacterized protein (TIGR00369 family)